MIKLENIKGMLIDLEGVLYNGDNIIEGAIDSINKVKSSNIQIRYLTNTTTTTKDHILKKLNNLNIPAKTNEIFSPIIAANNYLNKLKISKIFLMTQEILKKDFNNFILDDEKPEAIILGDIYKEFNWVNLNKTFQLINKNKALIIALHKNRYCRRENEISLDLGPFVSALEFASSSKAIIMGKPEKNFFDLAIQDMNLNNNEVIMIGDDIISDIEGAKNNNIYSIQVKTGKYQLEDELNRYLQPNHRLNSIKDLPDFIAIN
tara:strand:- start:60 stop:845 length:786 start_codon:yes stop_codon:yes gene_type:complete